MNELISILAGICFFLYGMQLSKEGLQHTGSDKLRHYIYRSTRNPLQAILLGCVVAFVLQSSTAATVMLVGFANVGIIEISNALAVALGAGIGTSLFVMLLSKVLLMPIQGYAVLLLMVGLLCLHLGRKRGSTAGRILLGFGFMLYGIKLISIAGDFISGHPYFIEQFTNMTERPVTTMVIAILLTVLLQSSIATIGILLSLSISGPVPLMAALPIVLGANIGTTSTILFASTQGSENGKRLALGQLLLKLAAAVPLMPFIEPIGNWLGQSFETSTEQIAVAHLGFNIFNALLFAPFLPWTARMLERLIPKELFNGDRFQVKYLDKNVLETPTLALGNVVREIIRMADIIQDMFAQFMDALEGSRPELIEKLEAMDDKVDILNREIKFYLARITQGQLSEDQAKTQLDFLGLTAVCEEIGDIINRNLGELTRKRIRLHLSFSDEGWKDIRNFHALVLENINLSITAFSTRNLEIAKKVLRHKNKIKDIFEELQQAHLTRLQGGLRESFATSALHMELLANMLRVNVLISKLVNPVVAGQQNPED